MRIAIVGAGLGGLAAALFLRQAGHRATVYEQAPVLREVGAGLVVPPNLVRPLARLGYMDYSVVTPESIFTMNRPIASDDGQGATLVSGAWDGVYR